MFFFNDTAPTELYTLSLHDALPISSRKPRGSPCLCCKVHVAPPWTLQQDRKSTRLNSSHLGISYAVFCLKKKKLIPVRLLRYLRSAGIPQLAISDTIATTPPHSWCI